MTDYNNRDYYINRELSWLSFNERVFEEALDLTNPLFERLRFLAITNSNLDEFFMVRVSGLKEQIKLGYNKPDSKTGMSPLDQLTAIFSETHKFVNNQYYVLYDSILPALNKEGIYILKPNELNKEQQEYASKYYNESIYPVLTPMAIDASHPFPMLLNKSINLAVQLEDKEKKLNRLFALVEVPSVLPRLIRIPSTNKQITFILLEDLIIEHIDSLFKGNRIVSVSPFRITKNADLDLDEEDVEDLLKTIEKEIKKRNLGSSVRLEVDYSVDDYLLKTLKNSLDLEEYDIYSLKGPLDLTFFNKLYELQHFSHLKFEEMRPLAPQDMIGEKDIFEAISDKDILLHHPFESFEPVVHFIQQASEDPNVLAIKQTLYRVSGNSPIIRALTKAAENGKQVTVLVELKARFDEENNITWAKKLEESGCHVIYGLVGLKTHSKITLIVRREKDLIKRYVHLSTGNYNDITAKYYTDIGMFTSRNDFGEDATAFFNHLSGYFSTPKWNQIMTAPNGLKDTIIKLIENEVEKHSAENPGRIIAKMNSLTNKDVIKALFKASSKGVKIDLIVRGICCLKPGIKDVSENIRVISIVGRYLEHSRIFYFNNGGDERIYLSSADLMTRNLEHRVEILFPVIQDNLKLRLKETLEIYLKDNVKARTLNPDGSYSKINLNNEFTFRSHNELYLRTLNSVKSRELDMYYNQLKPKTHFLTY